MTTSLDELPVLSWPITGRGLALSQSVSRLAPPPHPGPPRRRPDRDPWHFSLNQTRPLSHPRRNLPANSCREEVRVFIYYISVTDFSVGNLQPEIVISVIYCGDGESPFRLYFLETSMNTLSHPPSPHPHPHPPFPGMAITMVQCTNS